MPGRLIVIGTPIGNLEDLSPRARRALESVAVLACEDTRRTRTLFSALGLQSPPRLLAYHEHNEREAAPGLAQLIEAGQDVGLVSDGGMPGISDPGYRLLSLCREREIAVEVISGPNAALAALLASGLPTSSFTFKGFPPKKPGALKRFLDEEASSPHTLLFYDSPYHIARLLQASLIAFGDRPAALAAELTKKHERLYRGSLSQLVAALEKDAGKGEFVLVVAGFKD